MSRRSRIHRNLWSLTVLGLLRERPMHPYEIQRLIRERGKDQHLDLKRGSLYHAIDRLHAASLIEPVETSREGRRPERTTYRLTDEGEDVLLEWLRDMLSRPSQDPNEFVAAIAHLPHLPPEEAAECLQMRAVFLEAQIASLDTVLRTLTPRLGRVVLLEEDLVRAWKRSELEWACQLVDDLRTGVYRWDIEELRRNPDVIPGGPTSPATGDEEVRG